jgi:hypothetical protein
MWSSWQLWVQNTSKTHECAGIYAMHTSTHFQPLTETTKESKRSKPSGRQGTNDTTEGYELSCV